jgi:hypothetical protein
MKRYCNIRKEKNEEDIELSKCLLSPSPRTPKASSPIARTPLSLRRNAALSPSSALSPQVLTPSRQTAITSFFSPRSAASGASANAADVAAEGNSNEINDVGSTGNEESNVSDS